MPEIHAIILTRDEQKHIARCIESIRDVCDSILVVDSGSTDRTREIAASLGATVILNDWVNYAVQCNHAITALAERTGWFMRIDADEYLTAGSATGLQKLLARIPASVDGLLVQRQIIFMGRRIKWGGIEPNWQLRIWRAGTGVCESRWMDEHIVVDGGVSRTDIEIVDENFNSIDWWTTKHNNYASREAIDILVSRGLLDGGARFPRRGASAQAKFKRSLKNHVYNRLPGGFRALFFFLYRYVLRLGFLDGRSGYYFHILQGFWYRTLVDAKLTEILRRAKSTGAPIADVVRATTGIDPAAMQPDAKSEDLATTSTLNANSLPQADQTTVGHQR